MTTDRISGSLLALFALIIICENRVLPLGTFRQPGPGYMPVLLASLLLIFGILVAVTGRGSKRLGLMDWKEWRHAVAILIGCIFAALAFEWLGYRLTVLVVLTFLLGWVERKGWLLTAAFALGMALATFYLFHTVLRVPLPQGTFGI